MKSINITKNLCLDIYTKRKFSMRIVTNYANEFGFGISRLCLTIYWFDRARNYYW
jgi:hypothetical protein